MRPRAWLAWALLTVGLAFGFWGRAVDGRALSTLAGACFVAAIVVALSLLPFWKHILPPLPPMPGLFGRVPPGHRWCALCGHPTPRSGACESCGQAPTIRRGRLRKRAPGVHK